MYPFKSCRNWIHQDITNLCYFISENRSHDNQTVKHKQSICSTRHNNVNSMIILCLTTYWTRPPQGHRIQTHDIASITWQTMLGTSKFIDKETVFSVRQFHAASFSWLFSFAFPLCMASVVDTQVILLSSKNLAVSNHSHLQEVWAMIFMPKTYNIC